MRKFLITQSLLIVLINMINAVDFSPFLYKQWINKNGDILPYRILYPENMDSTKKIPLIVHLHDIGNVGSDNELQLREGASRFLKTENRQSYPCIVIYPQCGSKTAGWASLLGLGGLSVYGKMVVELIRNLINSGIVDEMRVYIRGYSLGGFGTYEIITQYPELFAAAVVCAGGTSKSKVPFWTGKVNFWIFHGTDDDVVSYQYAKDVMSVLDSNNIPYKKNIFEGAGHTIQAEMFDHPEAFSWLFAQTNLLLCINSQYDKRKNLTYNQSLKLIQFKNEISELIIYNNNGSILEVRSGSFLQFSLKHYSRGIYFCSYKECGQTNPIVVKIFIQ